MSDKAITKWRPAYYAQIAFVLAVGFALYTNHVEIRRLQTKNYVLEEKIAYQDSTIQQFAEEESNNWLSLLNWAKKVRTALEIDDARLEKLEQKP